MQKIPPGQNGTIALPPKLVTLLLISQRIADSRGTGYEQLDPIKREVLPGRFDRRLLVYGDLIPGELQHDLQAELKRRQPKNPPAKGKGFIGKMGAALLFAVGILGLAGSGPSP